MARILITGVSGLLGINLASETMNEHDIVGIDRGKLVNAPFQVMQEDLSDLTSVAPLLDAVRPAWLIHCAALADLDVCEDQPERAKVLNTDLPAELAKACTR
jgi:dTDP-4-dehydrorhamnose reductase